MFLTARRLFDGRTPHVWPGWGMEIEGGRIAAIGPARSMRPRSEVIDLGDVTLLPGLIDVHQHLAFDASGDPVGHLQAADDTTVLATMRRAARVALAAGITTVRDLGDRGYLSLTPRDEFAAGDQVGPRILAAGPPLTVTGGHCWFLGGEADGIDGVRGAVRDHAARGVDVIKIMATGGNLTPTLGPHQSQYSRAELSAAVEEAHAHGLPVAVHAHGGQGIADALAAGADSVEHCTFFTEDGVDADPAVLDRLARSRIAITMTGAVLPGSRPPVPAIRDRLAAILANHATLYRAGARIVCGSDAGVTPTKPHDVLPYGVSRFLPALGMTNAQALTSATATAAEVCGIADVTGTLQVGRDADVIAVAGDPIEDLAAIHDIVAVYARGRRVVSS
ncbi:MAG: amidohydrolase family protein [Mycobacteriales bacterium]